MGSVCMTPVKNSHQQKRRHPSMSHIGAGGFGGYEDASIHHQFQQSSANGHRTNIGHVTKINTLVMVGPGANEANFGALNTSAPSASSSSVSPLLQTMLDRDRLYRTKVTLELSMRQHALIEKCWREQIAKRHPDIFHRTMLNVIEASPKVNEVIACQRYCFRDLTKWPKLNRICHAQFIFFERLILLLNLNEEKLLAECIRLGDTHAQYAQFGLKPHFLDIFQHQFLGLLEKMQNENESEKKETIVAFQILITFILDVLNHAYSLKMSQLRLTEKNGGSGDVVTTLSSNQHSPHI